MAKDWAESSRETSNYGSFINQFPPDSRKSIEQLYRINKKNDRQKKVYNIQSNTYQWRNATQIYIYIYIHTRGAFNKFPGFFVQAFKFVIDSWTFSMLLLYILWDDWPIFMISRSNEQLQQWLEYTLLKPDCHRWSISKMQSDT